MEEFVAAALAVLVLGGAFFFVTYAIGSPACALSGAECGCVPKLGLGSLGMFVGAVVAVGLRIDLPPWVMGFVGAAFAAGLVRMTRRVRRLA